MQLTARAQRVLGCLVEKSLATPDHYPLSANALRSACNQTTGRDPVVSYQDEEVRSGLDELKSLELVRTQYARGSRVPKSAHRLAEQLDLDPAQQAVLALLLLRGPQTTGELRSRAGRMYTFSSVELVEAVLGSLAAHRFGALTELCPREPGRREARWRHALGDAPTPPASTASDLQGRYRPFRDAVASGDLERAIAQLSPDVVFRSPAVHSPYEGRDTTAGVLLAVRQVLSDLRYIDVLDAGDSAVLVFTARIGDRDLQGIDHLRFDHDGRIAELTVMIRPLSGLLALVEAMQPTSDQR